MFCPSLLKEQKPYQKENYHGSEVEIKAPQKIYGQEERQVSYFSARYDLLPAQSPGI
ncbi:MAG: hypothetical protein HOK49_15430 [Opitutae bacterium]|nr:hypothetical protein [Opitutae bacterium]MBT6463909.1 hypothetical protein [Opitutae bacterium]